MATFKAYPNGLTIGTGNPNPPKNQRGKIQGWTAAAARRQVRWLYSVETSKLDGVGYAVTLTLRDCPATADEWHAARKAWIERIRRLGFIRVHWVTEWQKRQVPHLHAAVYVDQVLPRDGLEFVLAWLDVVRARGWVAGHQGQDVKRIDGAQGWLQYLSKHAGRSVAHYQRMGVPAGWERTGRLWGYGGRWPVQSPVEGDIDNGQFCRLRRLIDRYLLAQAVAQGDTERVQYLRTRRSKETDPLRSRVLGLSEWLDYDVFLTLLEISEYRWQPEP